MSSAEIRAHEIYTSMQLGNIDDEVRRHLMILLLTQPFQNTDEQEYIPSSYEEAMQMGAQDIEFVREDLHAYVDQLAIDHDIR